MKYHLGLDLGTTSIGAVAIDPPNLHEPLTILAQQLHIFPEPNERDNKGALVPKKAERRLARQQRTQLTRRAQRLRHIAQLASLLGLNPKSLAPDNGQNLPRLRAIAASEPIAVDDLLRIFIKMAKRRGYAGGFRTQTNKDVGEVRGGVERLQTLMQEYGCQTLGEYLYSRYQRGLPIHLKTQTAGNNGKKSTIITDPEHENLYATRELVEQEFAIIWATQARFHAILNTQHEGKPLQDIFHDVIFYQRPLKSVSTLVGKCPLQSNLPRAPRAHPSVQAFRIEKQLADMRWGMRKHAEPLSFVQKAIIREHLQQHDKLSFKQIETLLAQAGHPKPLGTGLNLEHLGRDQLHGDTTLSAWRKLGMESAWLALSHTAQTQAINLLADMGSPEQFDTPQWHTQIHGEKKNQPRHFDATTISFINALVATGKFGRLKRMGLEDGRAAYSISAANKLTAWLQNNTSAEPLSEYLAIDACYPHAHQPVTLQERLPLPEKTGNQVVDSALRQLYRTLNQFHQQLGAYPDRIVVEMSRELGQGVTRRNEIQNQQTINQNNRTAISKILQEANYPATERNIRRYWLAEEQDWHCPYCQGHNVFTLNEVMDGKITHFEHILPRSLTRIGLKNSEIVLAHSHCNDAKGNQTPYQAWGTQQPERWQAVEKMAAILQTNAKKYRAKNPSRSAALYRKAKLLCLQDFENDVLTDESIADFSDRQFHDTSWIAKAATQWLRQICADVDVSRGQMTAHLRRIWGLETVIPEVRLAHGLPVLDENGTPITAEQFHDFRPAWEGHRYSHSGQTVDIRLEKRLDHRHHLIDALTIALTSRSLYQAMATHYRQDCERNQRPVQSRIRLYADPPCGDLRSAAVAMIRDCHIQHKPDHHPNGQLFDANAFGIAEHPETHKRLFTRRYAIAALITEKDKEEKARKAIQSIISNSVRELVMQHLDTGLSQGLTPYQALQVPLQHPQYSRENKPVYIKKVKCYDNSAENAKAITHRTRQGVILTKYLKSKGYAWLEINVENGKLVGDPQLVPLHEATQRPTKVQGITRFYKGDIVFDPKDQRHYRIGYFKAEGNVFLIPNTDPRSFDAIKEANAGKKRLAFSQMARLILMNP